MEKNESTMFVQRLHGRLDHTTDGVVAWLHKHPTSGRVEQIYDVPGQVPSRAVRRWSGGDVWASVGTFLPHRRAAKNSCCVPALWVDLDPPEENSAGLAAWQCATYRRLLAFVPSPSLIVFSGRGHHGYWLFTEPVRVRDSHDRARLVVQANRVLERRLKGDTVGDLARVMRVPGTANPRSKARSRLLVENGAAYEFDALLSALEVDSSPLGHPTVASPTPMKGGGGETALVSAPGVPRLPRGRGRPALGVTRRDLRSLPAWARPLVVGGVWSAKGRYRRPGGLDRSRADLAAIGAMVRAGWPDSRIRAPFRRRDWFVGARYRQLAAEGTQRADDYIGRTITTARGGMR